MDHDSARKIFSISTRGAQPRGPRPTSRRPSGCRDRDDEQAGCLSCLVADEQHARDPMNVDHVAAHHQAIIPFVTLLSVRSEPCTMLGDGARHSRSGDNDGSQDALRERSDRARPLHERTFWRSVASCWPQSTCSRPSPCHSRRCCRIRQITPAFTIQRCRIRAGATAHAQRHHRTLRTPR